MIAKSTALTGVAVALLSGYIPIRGGQSVLEPERAERDDHAGIEQQIFAELVNRNQIRNKALLGYIAARTYRVRNFPRTTSHLG